MFSVSPGAVIGFRRNGSPIRLIGGGSVDEVPAGQPEQDPVSETVVETAEKSDGQEPGRTFDESYVRRLREEAAANRVKARELEQQLRAVAEKAEQGQQEIVQKIAQALGIGSEEKPPSPEELARELESARRRETDKERQLRYLQTENAARDVAFRLGADVPTLMDSRSFVDSLKRLDPSAEEFSSQLDALVKETLDKNPRYKAVQVAPVSGGGDFSGGTGSTKERQRPSSLFEAVANKFAAGS